MVHHIDENSVNEEVVLNSQRLMILDVYSDECIPCQMLSPILNELDKKYPEVQIYKLDVSEAQNFATINGISAIPTLIFYKDGEEKERIVGLESIDTLEAIIKNYSEN